MLRFYAQRSIEHTKPPTLYYNKKTRQAHSIFDFRAKLSDTHSHMFLFPFDQYFLDIKIRWRAQWHSQKYVVLHYSKNDDDHLSDDGAGWFAKETFGSAIWKRQGKRQFRSKPLQISLYEEIWNEMQMLPAWIDFNTFAFKLIRLRIVPNPSFFTTHVLFPFLMIVSCSFSIFAIDCQSAKERLGVSVIILLTCTAFQSLVADQLPQRSRMLLIDWWICLAFLIQILLVISTLLISALIQLDVDFDTIYFFDTAMGATLGAIWIIFSAFYLSLKNTTMLDLYDKCCCCLNLSFNDWEGRGIHANRRLLVPGFRDVGFTKIDGEESDFGLV